MGKALATAAVLASSEPSSGLLAERHFPCGSTLTTRGAAPALSVCPLVVGARQSNLSFHHLVDLHISLLLYRIMKVNSDKAAFMFVLI